MKRFVLQVLALAGVVLFAGSLLASTPDRVLHGVGMKDGQPIEVYRLLDGSGFVTAAGASVYPCEDYWVFPFIRRHNCGDGPIHSRWWGDYGHWGWAGTAEDHPDIDMEVCPPFCG